MGKPRTDDARRLYFEHAGGIGAAEFRIIEAEVDAHRRRLEDERGRQYWVHWDPPFLPGTRPTLVAANLVEVDPPA